MSCRTFVGFGFGAIQSGLFLAEAYNSRKFERLVVAEVMPSRVAAIRQNGGAFAVNVATANQRLVQHIMGVEVFNPTVRQDAEQLVAALADASEISTALPSIDFYARGTPAVADLLREALRRKIEDPPRPAAVVYTAENNNHAAEALHKQVFQLMDIDTMQNASLRMQVLNTVIGKMSSVVSGPEQIRELSLAPMVPGASEAFLVEAFNRILVSRVKLPGFVRGIDVFEEKPDLLPFEEAKLFGHNAIHALLGYLAHERGLRAMSELAAHPDLVAIGRRAFIEECGSGLIKKYRGLDPLFTEDGFRAYADDLLARMLNPWLQDPVARVVRDPFRKLGWNDRLVGAIRLAMAHGIQPVNLLRGVRAAIRTIPGPAPLDELVKQWTSEGADDEHEIAMTAAAIANR